jgi:hypothetical protein
MGRSPRYALAAALLFLLAAALLTVGCGQDEELDVKEGEPVELGPLRYNVQLTRFLNRTNVEDRDYLVGQRPAPSGQKYLAVFIEIENDSDATASLPSDVRIVDTRGTVYAPVPSQSLYALKLGTQVPPDGELPAADTTAANGPTGGAMILFLIRDEATENRPLELEIPGIEGEVGKIELDI